MSASIPASQIVNVTPGVLAAGGSALILNGLMLDDTDRVPIGKVLSFPDVTSVKDYFGPSSKQGALASNYFLGFDNSNIKPGSMLRARYNVAAAGAYLRGGDVSALTLSQLQALAGVLTVSINGTPHTSTAINLTAATSFSAAAELISLALGVAGPAGASFTGAIAATTLTVSAVTSGTLAIGQEVKGTGITAGTMISAFLTGTGTTGTYTVSNSQTVASEAMTTNTPTVAYDSVAGAFKVVSSTTGAASTISYGSGTIAAGIKLTQATGAILSQGANAGVPGDVMDTYAAFTQNWATFATAFDPDVSGNDNKLAFAAWANLQLDRYLYVAWDDDITPTESMEASTSLGQLLYAGDYSGTELIYSPGQGATLAAFEMGAIASVDFAETNGRTTMAFRHQTGITPDITDGTIAQNLLANHYNFYGRYGTANDDFNWFINGTVSGPFLWVDSFINQIWFGNQLQLAGMVLLDSVKAIPYNERGRGLIRAAFLDPINQAANFGALAPGIVLSESQKAQVNSAAGGLRISDTLSFQGWYLQVLDASPQVRQARIPALHALVYGRAIGPKLNLASVAVL